MKTNPNHSPSAPNSPPRFRFHPSRQVASKSFKPQLNPLPHFDTTNRPHSQPGRHRDTLRSLRTRQLKERRINRVIWLPITEAVAPPALCSQSGKAQCGLNATAQSIPAGLLSEHITKPVLARPAFCESRCIYACIPLADLMLLDPSGSYHRSTPHIPRPRFHRSLCRPRQFRGVSLQPCPSCAWRSPSDRTYKGWSWEFQREQREGEAVYDPKRTHSDCERQLRLHQQRSVACSIQ